MSKTAFFDPELWRCVLSALFSHAKLKLDKIAHFHVCLVSIIVPNYHNLEKYRVKIFVSKIIMLENFHTLQKFYSCSIYLFYVVENVSRV